MDVTEATFEEEVLLRSHEVAVVVDFWAAWCGPCRQLTPILEAAAARREGDVVLAKVDIDANPGLAQRYGIMSIPDVKAFRDGRVVAEFLGLQPAASVEAFFNQVTPTEVDRLIAAGDEASLREALVRDAGATRARVALGRLLIGEERGDEALEVLEPAVPHDQEAEGLAALVALAGSERPDAAAALAALQRGDREAALAHLLELAQSSSDETRATARAAMVGIFLELGDQHPLTQRFRRRLARALY